MKYLLLAGLFSFSAFAQPLDVCRTRHEHDKVYCQHFRSGKLASTRIRSIKTIDGWVAVPCKQLKKRIPEIDCRPQMGAIRLGEPLEK